MKLVKTQKRTSQRGPIVGNPRSVAPLLPPVNADIFVGRCASASLCDRSHYHSLLRYSTNENVQCSGEQKNMAFEVKILNLDKLQIFQQNTLQLFCQFVLK